LARRAKKLQLAWNGSSCRILFLLGGGNNNRA
jgi:hypothetical protein